MQQRITVFRKRVPETNLQVERARLDTPRTQGIRTKRSSTEERNGLNPYGGIAVSARWHMCREAMEGLPGVNDHSGSEGTISTDRRVSRRSDR